MDEVTEQRGHASEGERRDGQELPHAEVEVPAREVRIVERLEEVVVVVPHAAEDVRLVDHMPASTRFCRSGRGVVADVASSSDAEWGGFGKVL